jgi:hypothetical protein
MTINAESLRNLVIENRWEEKRLSATSGQLCPNDYKELTELYKAALDALTDWAAIDYVHAPADGKDDAAFTAVKNILALYDNGDTRIIIDRQSMRTMRDCATKPKRLYSDEYKDAKKALEEAGDDKDKLEAATKELSDKIMPIGAKMYQQAGGSAADGETKTHHVNADDNKDDGAVEGEVVE